MANRCFIPTQQGPPGKDGLPGHPGQRGETVSPENMKYSLWARGNPCGSTLVSASGPFDVRPHTELETQYNFIFHTGTDFGYVEFQIGDTNAAQTKLWLLYNFLLLWQKWWFLYYNDSWNSWPLLYVLVAETAVPTFHSGVCPANLVLIALELLMLCKWMAACVLAAI